MVFQRLISRHVVVLALWFGASMLALPISQSHACACCGTYRVVRVADWDVLNVRSGPGTGYQVIMTLEPDEGCIIRTGERRRNWVRIEAQGLFGWVNRKFLRIIR